MKRIITMIALLLLAFAALPAMAQLDRDGDGISNKDDACPFRAGPKANNGCPLADDMAPNPPAPPAPADTDGDGLPDSDDQCPTVSGPRENRGCPANNEPVNPDTSVGGAPNTDQPAASGDLTSNPMPDTDGDGTTDDKDACPAVWGPYENGGCPLDPPPAPDGLANEQPAFTPPLLPTDGCYVTSGSSSNVNVRKTAEAGGEVIGYLTSGVVYASIGYVTVDTGIWYVIPTYEGSAGTAGYSSGSVLLTSSCAETATTLTPSVDGSAWGMNITTGVVEGGDDTPTIEYCVYQEVKEAGVFEEVCYEVEVPEGCTVVTSEAGVFTFDCGNGTVSVNPLFDDLPAEGLQVPTRDSELGVTLGIKYSPGDGSDTNTVEYCIYQEVEEVGVFKQVCYEVEVPEGCWLESAEAGVFTTQCRPEIGGRGLWLVGPVGISPDVHPNLPEGVVIADEPVNPLDLTIIPSSSSSEGQPMTSLSLNFTKIEYKNTAQGLEMDLRDTEIVGTQTHDDGSTTVEYCIYVELYEVGVFNKVCYQVEVPANCVLTTSEAGVYTVVCEEEGVVSLNPDLEDLPAMDLTVEPVDQGYILIELLPVKASAPSQAILIGMLLPAVQK
jgi:hypothetical protein